MPADGYRKASSLAVACILDVAYPFTSAHRCVSRMHDARTIPMVTTGATMTLTTAAMPIRTMEPTTIVTIMAVAAIAHSTNLFGTADNIAHLDSYSQLCKTQPTKRI